MGRGDRQPVHWFGAKQVSWIQVDGDLAYVQLMDANLSDVEGYAVVDLRLGTHAGQGHGDRSRAARPQPDVATSGGCQSLLPSIAPRWLRRYLAVAGCGRPFYLVPGRTSPDS
jgi:hypothetical protein